MADLEALTEKAQEMGAAVPGIYAILVRGGQLRIIDDGSGSTIRGIHEYFNTHGCDVGRMHLRYVKCHQNHADRRIEHYLRRGEEPLYRKELTPQVNYSEHPLPQTP
jgi:hypothetical protein